MAWKSNLNTKNKAIGIKVIVKFIEHIKATANTKQFFCSIDGLVVIKRI